MLFPGCQLKLGIDPDFSNPIGGWFHLDGMRGTPKDGENFAIIDTFIDTAAISLKMIVSKLRLHSVFEPDAALRIWFRSS